MLPVTVPALVEPSPQVNCTVSVAPATGSVKLPLAVTEPPSLMLPGVMVRAATGIGTDTTVTVSLAGAPGPTSSVDVAVMVSDTLVCPAGTTFV